jgi:hypothetical protein
VTWSKKVFRTLRVLTRYRGKNFQSPGEKKIVSEEEKKLLSQASERSVREEI